MRRRPPALGVAEVGRYRSFLLDPAPAIAPVAGGASKITGKARAGRILRCRAPRFTGDVKQVTTRGTYLDSQAVPRVLGKRRAYRVTRRARGKQISCRVEASNAGSPALAPPDSVAVPR